MAHSTDIGEQLEKLAGCGITLQEKNTHKARLPGGSSDSFIKAVGDIPGMACWDACATETDMNKPGIFP